MKQNDASPRIDPGLFFLRLTGSLLLLYVHGLPKVLHFSEELTRIEDPFGFGPYASLIPAIVAEVICPLLIVAGVYTRGVPADYRRAAGGDAGGSSELVDCRRAVWLAAADYLHHPCPHRAGPVASAA